MLLRAPVPCFTRVSKSVQRLTPFQMDPHLNALLLSSIPDLTTPTSDQVPNPFNSRASGTTALGVLVTCHPRNSPMSSASHLSAVLATLTATRKRTPTAGRAPGRASAPTCESSATAKELTSGKKTTLARWIALLTYTTDSQICISAWREQVHRSPRQDKTGVLNVQVLGLSKGPITARASIALQWASRAMIGSGVYSGTESGGHADRVVHFGQKSGNGGYWAGLFIDFSRLEQC